MKAYQFDIEHLHIGIKNNSFVTNLKCVLTHMLTEHINLV